MKAWVPRLSPATIDVKQVRIDAQAGRLSMEEVLDLLDAVDRLRAHDQQTIQRLRGEIDRLQQRLAQYEPDRGREATSDPSVATFPSVHYSLDAEEKRRQRRKRKQQSPGRRPTARKFAEAEHVADVVPEGVRRQDCALVRERAVWRLEDGRAVRVGLPHFCRPRRQRSTHPRRHAALRIRHRNPGGARLPGVHHRHLAGQGLCRADVLLPVALGQVAGRCLAAAVGPALGRRVRHPLRPARPCRGGLHG